MIRPYDTSINIDTPACPDCGDDEHVWKRVRYEAEELQLLGWTGVVATEQEEFREEIGWSWYCTDCKEEWGHEGVLTDLIDGG